MTICAVHISGVDVIDIALLGNHVSFNSSRCPACSAKDRCRAGPSRLELIISMFYWLGIKPCRNIYMQRKIMNCESIIVARGIHGYLQDAGGIMYATHLDVSLRSKFSVRNQCHPCLCKLLTSLRHELYVPASQWTATSSQQEETHNIL